MRVVSVFSSNLRNTGKWICLMTNSAVSWIKNVTTSAEIISGLQEMNRCFDNQWKLLGLIFKQKCRTFVSSTMSCVQICHVSAKWRSQGAIWRTWKQWCTYFLLLIEKIFWNNNLNCKSMVIAAVIFCTYLDVCFCYTLASITKCPWSPSY